jgi:hypothetical protein
LDYHFLPLPVSALLLPQDLIGDYNTQHGWVGGGAGGGNDPSGSRHSPPFSPPHAATTLNIAPPHATYKI